MLVDPVLYNRIFEQDTDGKAILAELLRLFYDRPSYKKGDDGMMAAYGEGQRSVVSFILHKTGIVEEDLA